MVLGPWLLIFDTGRSRPASRAAGHGARSNQNGSWALGLGSTPVDQRVDQNAPLACCLLSANILILLIKAEDTEPDLGNEPAARSIKVQGSRSNVLIGKDRDYRSKDLGSGSSTIFLNQPALVSSAYPAP